MTQLTRRDAISLLGTPALAAALSEQEAEAQSGSGAIDLHWVDTVPTVPTGVTWGVPFPQGVTPARQRFALTAGSKALSLSQWPLAYWPDGSIKWMGFATVTSGDSGNSSSPRLTRTTADAESPIAVRQLENSLQVAAGRVVASVGKQGANLIESLSIDGREVARNGRLVCSLEDRSQLESERIVRYEDFVSDIKTTSVEHVDSVRVVLKIEGLHKSPQREWLPFTVRLYFYTNAEPIRLIHTIIFDGDDQKDFIRSLGVSFQIPLQEQPHNRHVSFSNEGGGLWSEPIQPLTGRRVLNYQGADVYPDQLAGKAIPNAEKFDRQGQALMRDWAVWDGFKLAQTTPNGFTVHKRATALGCWLEAGAGKRSTGYGFLGESSPEGKSRGFGIGIKNFWQSYPTALEIEKAATGLAEFRAWLWSPDAPAMDLRHYDVKAHGLEASYEDVQPGFSTPHGVARTSELTLFPSAKVPTKPERVLQAVLAQEPPILAVTPQYAHAAGVFGFWSLPDRSTPMKQQIENRLDAALAFYQKEVDQRSWYGYWNFGDIMHQYDTNRHVWRYDVGGFAWDNSELVPDMWLWYSYLRTGRADVFRMAEAMTRHTGEVDTYHVGRFAKLGSRHNVRHWGCGAKEARISQAALRRFYYYLTADERTGDVMREMVDADYRLTEIDPMRLARPTSERPSSYPARVRGGPDWTSFVGNWMTEWERTGQPKYRDKILAGMESIAAMPYGFLSGPEALFGYDPATGKLYTLADDPFGAYNLAMIMGGAEVLFELEPLLNNGQWSKVWLQYCKFLGAPKDVVKREMTTGNAEPLLGGRANGGGAGGRLWAYCYYRTKDRKYAEQARQTLMSGPNRPAGQTRTVAAPEVMTLIEEIPGLSTNSTSQWCLNAIEILAMCSDAL